MHWFVRIWRDYFADDAFDVATTPSPIAEGHPLEIILIHGTFAPNSPWTRTGSRLQKKIQERFPNATIFPFEWSGGNTHLSRNHPLIQLFRDIQKKGFEGNFPDRIIVAHSHGGNIAIGLIRFLNEISDQLLLGVVTISTPFIRSELPANAEHTTGAGRNWWWLLLFVEGYMISPNVFNGWSVSLGIVFGLVMEAIEIFCTARWYRAAKKAHNWDISHASNGKHRVPVLALTSPLDEAYLGLHIISRMQSHLRLFREHNKSLLEIIGLTAPCWRKLGLLVTFPLRPLITALSLLNSFIAKTAFGQGVGTGMILDLNVTRSPPPDFVNQELKFFPAMHSILNHSGVYENPDALDYMAEWLLSRIVQEYPQPRNHPVNGPALDASVLSDRESSVDHPLHDLFADFDEFLNRDPVPFTPTEETAPGVRAMQVQIAPACAYVKLVSAGLKIFMLFDAGNWVWIAREAPGAGSIMTGVSADVRLFQMWRRTKELGLPPCWFIVVDDKTLYNEGVDAKIPFSQWSEIEIGEVWIVTESCWSDHLRAVDVNTYEMRYSYTERSPLPLPSTPTAS